MAGARDAIVFGEACAQPSSLGAVAPSVEPFMGGLLPGPMDAFGEDCLSVNVFTPAVDGGRRPVMMWFHGGGHTVGSGNLAPYDGTSLARLGDVVVVTVNHRLGALGYLSLAGLAAGDEYATSGSVGLLDMVASLHWVRDNASAFGGDPGNVTIFGESGGGSKVSVLLGTPAASGLFHRAIVQSGPTIEGEVPEAAARTTAAVMAELGVTTIDELVAVPVDTLVAAQFKVLGSALGGSFGSGHRLGPVVDGVVLPAHPFEPTASPASATVPLMIGTCRDEMTMFLLDSPAFVGATHETGEQVALAVSGGVTGLYEVYRAHRPGMSPARILVAIATEWFRLGSITLAERKVAAGTAPVWMYRCDVSSPANGGAFGATHGIDLPLMFGNLPHPLLDGHPHAAEVSATMMATWVQFARTGDPNNTSVPPWRIYAQDERATLLLDSECTIEHDPDGDERRAWAADDHAESPSPTRTNATTVHPGAKPHSRAHQPARRSRMGLIDGVPAPRGASRPARTLHSHPAAVRPPGFRRSAWPGAHEFTVRRPAASSLGADDIGVLVFEGFMSRLVVVVRLGAWFGRSRRK